MSASTAQPNNPRPNNPQNSRDIRTKAIVLRRVNYGEADRILDLLTEDGPVAVIAKGVRKEKSKLAGGIELFCLSDITYHRHRTGGLAILTSAKMQKFYGNIMQSFDKMSFAAEVLKHIARASEGVEGPEFFQLAQPVLEALNTDAAEALIETYFWLNFAAVRGEQPNLSRDTTGARLQAEQAYAWDSTELAFAPHPHGTYGANEIKYLRLMLTGSLPLATRVRYPAEKLPDLLYIAKSLNQL